MNESKKRALWVSLLLVTSCLVTSVITAWFVQREARFQCGQAVDFDARKASLIKWLSTCEVADGEVLPSSGLPGSLARAGVIRVSRRGRFIIFQLASTSLIPSLDAADEYFVYTADQKGGAVEELIAMLGGRGTYHIQYLSTPGWYYWMHG